MRKNCSTNLCVSVAVLNGTYGLSHSLEKLRDIIDSIVLHHSQK